MTSPAGGTEVKWHNKSSPLLCSEAAQLILSHFSTSCDDESLISPKRTLTSGPKRPRLDVKYHFSFSYLHLDYSQPQPALWTTCQAFQAGSIRKLNHSRWLDDTERGDDSFTPASSVVDVSVAARFSSRFLHSRDRLEFVVSTLFIFPGSLSELCLCLWPSFKWVDLEEHKAAKTRGWGSQCSPCMLHKLLFLLQGCYFCLLMCAGGIYGI